MASVGAILGLGNPGPEYRFSRHNLGFLVVDRLAERQGVRLRSDGPELRSARWRCGGREVWLAQPTTFMNRSGAGALRLCRGHGVDPGEMLVVVDDLDLPLGQIRLRGEGGAGTHNGMRSLLAAVGPGFPRLRVGIGPAPVEEDLAEWVLGVFPEAQQQALTEAVDAAAECVESAVRGGLHIAMNRYNRRSPPEGGTAN